MSQHVIAAIEKLATPVWKFYSLFDNPHLDISHPSYHGKGDKHHGHH